MMSRETYKEDSSSPIVGGSERQHSSSGRSRISSARRKGERLDESGGSAGDSPNSVRNISKGVFDVSLVIEDFRPEIRLHKQIPCCPTRSSAHQKRGEVTWTNRKEAAK